MKQQGASTKIVRKNSDGKGTRMLGQIKKKILLLKQKVS